MILSVIGQQQIYHSAIAFYAVVLAVCFEIGVIDRVGNLRNRPFKLLPIGAVIGEVPLDPFIKRRVDLLAQFTIGAVKGIVGIDKRQHSAGILEFQILTVAAGQISDKIGFVFPHIPSKMA